MKQNNPFNSLSIRYPQVKYYDGSINQKAFFEHGSHESSFIPLKERIDIMAKFVHDGYNIHNLVDSYLDDKDALDDDRRKHDIAFSFYAYSLKLVDNFLDSIGDKKHINKNLKQLIREFYDEDRCKKGETCSEEMQRRIDEFINLVNEIYMENLEKNQNSNLPVFLIRANYHDGISANNVGKLVDYLYENDIVSINVKDKTGADDDNYYHNVRKGTLSKEDKDPKMQYIHRFCQLEEEVSKSNVIVVAQYVGKLPKIGLIKKGSKVFCREEKGEVYKLYCLKMEKERVQCISSAITRQFLSTLVPTNVTISPIRQKQTKIRCIFDNEPIPVKLSSVSDPNLEKLCAEYLRSRFSYKQVIVLGGIFPDIDIIGFNNKNELFAAQVSRAMDKKLIDEKKEKLCSFEDAKHKIMFSTHPTDEKANPLNYNIQDVWEYFDNESNKKFLDLLIKL